MVLVNNCVGVWSKSALSDILVCIVSVEQQLEARPACPYCDGSHIIKYGHKDISQRFFCKDCIKTFMYTLHTLQSGSYFDRSVWNGFIRDTPHGEPLDSSAERFGFSYQIAFNYAA